MTHSAAGDTFAYLSFSVPTPVANTEGERDSLEGGSFVYKRRDYRIALLSGCARRHPLSNMWVLVAQDPCEPLVLPNLDFSRSVRCETVSVSFVIRTGISLITEMKILSCVLDFRGCLLLTMSVICSFFHWIIGLIGLYFLLFWDTNPFLVENRSGKIWDVSVDVAVSLVRVVPTDTWAWTWGWRGLASVFGYSGVGESTH